METQCLLFWPDEHRPFTAAAASPKSGTRTFATPTAAGEAAMTQYLVGWNPRGTTVCVVDFVNARNADEADIEARRIRKAHEDIMPGLRLLGRVHPARPDGTLPPMRTDDGSKVRRNGELWVELISGPALIELYVCGFRVPAQLFVVHYNVRQQYSIKPARLSAVSRLGYQGVKRALQGEKATDLCPGTISRVEGSFLPPHRANLNVIRRTDPSPGYHFADNTSLTGDVPNFGANFGSTSSLDAPFQSTNATGSAPVLESTLVPDSTVDGLNDSAAAFHDTSLQSIAPDPNDSQYSEWSEGKIDNSTPPRLNFPTWASTTELAYVLKCINQGREIRRVARNPSYVPYSDSQAIIKDGPLKASLRHAVELVRIALQGLLVVVTFAARFSYVCATLEFKLRELICCLAVSSHCATACGLHAFLPHSFVDEDVSELGKTRGSITNPNPTRNTLRRRVERRQCLAHYVTRSAVDIVLGWCSAFC
jgi:hypothetical protein